MGANSLIGKQMHLEALLVQQVSTARVYPQKRQNPGGALSQQLRWPKSRNSKLCAKTPWAAIKDISI